MRSFRIKKKSHCESHVRVYLSRKQTNKKRERYFYIGLRSVRLLLVLPEISADISNNALPLYVLNKMLKFKQRDFIKVKKKE